MKMVKSLLLGSAAGVVAMAGAQAADLPVKAKPVQYVKICSLYGAGFYYIPGTDTCLKVGGWVRQYIGVNSNNNLTNGYLGSGNLATRASNNGWAYKSRGYITADARTQTEWGTLRGYIAVGESTQGSQGASVFNSNRAFIQLAGFTFGVSQSFFDLFPQPAVSYFGGMIAPSNDTGDGGQTVTAYTAQFGGGLSATLSLEAPRTTSVIGPNIGTASTNATFSLTAGPPSSAVAEKMPDVVANLRMDAAWGTAQVMGALHDASGTYYTGAALSTASQTTSAGNPSDALGWAIAAGVKINVPMAGPGDYLSAQVSYTQGALGYLDDGAVSATPATGVAGGYYGVFNGASGYGFGVIADSVYANGGSIQLTTAWSVNGAYEHFWTKRWQTSVYGTYMATSFNAVANTQLCAGETALVPTAVGTCNNNWKYWDIGTRTQFNVDSQTYIGLDVIYTKLQTADSGITGTFPASGTQPSTVRTIGDQSAWMAEFRVHRNFYP
jgi:hypothetical protein